LESAILDEGMAMAQLCASFFAEFVYCPDLLPCRQNEFGLEGRQFLACIAYFAAYHIVNFAVGYAVLG
jgi:hypothetical protein